MSASYEHQSNHGCNDIFLEGSCRVECEWSITCTIRSRTDLAALNKIGLTSIRAARKAFEPWVTWHDTVDTDVRRGGVDGALHDTVFGIPLDGALRDELVRTGTGSLLRAASQEGVVAIGSESGPIEVTYICVPDFHSAILLPSDAGVSVTTRLRPWLSASTDGLGSASLERALRSWESLVGFPIDEWSVQHTKVRSHRYGFTIVV